MGPIIYFIKSLLNKPDEWEYGTAGCDERPARRHIKKHNVQFVLWSAGEQGHDEDYWYDFDTYWWSTFKPSDCAKDAK